MAFGAMNLGPLLACSIPIGFDPNSLPGLAFWAAARRETIYASGGAVSRMTDWSSQANHLTSAAGTNEPTYQTNIINGQAIYRFDGTNDYLRNTAVTGMADWSQSDHAVIAVIRMSSVTEEDLLSASNSGAGNTLLMVISTGRGHSWRGAGDANAINTTTTLLTSTNYILSYWCSATQNAIYLNGTREAGPTNLTGAAGDGNEQIFVGNRSGSYADGWFSGDVAEILVYTTAPSDADMLTIIRWLNSIYSIY